MRDKRRKTPAFPVRLIRPYWFVNQRRPYATLETDSPSSVRPIRRTNTEICSLKKNRSARARVIITRLSGGPACLSSLELSVGVLPPAVAVISKSIPITTIRTHHPNRINVHNDRQSRRDRFLLYFTRSALCFWRRFRVVRRFHLLQCFYGRCQRDDNGTFGDNGFRRGSSVTREAPAESRSTRLIVDGRWTPLRALRGLGYSDVSTPRPNDGEQ